MQNILNIVIEKNQAWNNNEVQNNHNAVGFLKPGGCSEKVVQVKEGLQSLTLPFVHNKKDLFNFIFIQANF